MSCSTTPRDSVSRLDGTTRVVDRKVWQEWPGYHYFYLDGQFMMPRQWKGSLGTVLLVVTLESSFVGLVAVKLLSPINYIAILSGCILAIFACFFLLSTCFTDPGVLPKLEPSEAYLRMQLPRVREVPFGERQVTIRYDDVYHYYRPPRAHHCRALNVVVMKFDHFCPWTGNTIGERNYRAFVSFLLFAALALLHAAGFCVLHILQHINSDSDEGAAAGGPQLDPRGALVPAADNGADDGRNDTVMDKLIEIIATPLLLMVMAAFILAVGGLLGFHISLIARGQTTYESIEGTGSTFSEGCSKNCWTVWCAPMPPQYVDFSLTLRAAHARQPPAVIRMCNPHLAGERGTRGDSGRDHRNGRPPGREPQQERGRHGGRSNGRSSGHTSEGYARSPGRHEAQRMDHRVVLAGQERSNGGGWDKYSPRGGYLGHVRRGDEVV